MEALSASSGLEAMKKFMNQWHGNFLHYFPKQDTIHGRGMETWSPKQLHHYFFILFQNILVMHEKILKDYDRKKHNNI